MVGWNAVAELAELAEEVVQRTYSTPRSEIAAYHLSRSYPADYWDEASCTSVDREIFFPEKAQKNQVHISQVKAICVACPIRTRCLQFALDEQQQYGIWGGLSYKERRELQKVLNG